MSRPFEDLWADYLEGDLDAAGIVELNEMLAADEELLRKATDLYEEHRLLGLALQPFDSDRFVEAVQTTAASDRDEFVGNVLNGVGVAATKPSRPHNRLPSPYDSWPRPTHLLATALVLSLLVALFAWWRVSVTGTPPETVPIAGSELPTDSSERPIATLLLAEDCVWSDGDAPQEGERLGGRTLELKSGLAVVRFDGGAELVMSGETSIELSNSDCAELHYGEVVVQAENGADGFELKTPASSLIDLGTEFAARVDRSGATDVHVIDGEVEYSRGESAVVLSAGNAIHFGEKDEAVREATWNSQSFDEILREADPKPQPHRMTAYEGFYYEPGTLPLEKTTKGKGWAGPWRLRLPNERRLPETENSREFFEIVHGQMNVTWPVPGGRKGMLKLPAESAYYVRPMRKSIDLDRAGVTFFSMMVRETQRPRQQKRPRERVRVTFRSLADYYAEYISFGHGTGYQPQVRTGDGSLHVSPLVMPAEQTTLWIGKIVARAQGEDEIYFRVYGEEDVLGYAEPATWHVATRGVDLSARFDCVLLSSEGTTSRIVDELRIGPTWRSVAPMLERSM